MDLIILGVSKVTINQLSKNVTYGLYTLVLFFIIHVQCFGQGSPGRHYYVIAGAYSSEENALRFASQIDEQKYNPSYALNAERDVYYVILLETEDKKEAYAYGAQLRSQTLFKDSWVYSGKLTKVVSDELLVQETPEEEEEVMAQAEEEESDVMVEPEEEIQEEIMTIAEVAEPDVTDEVVISENPVNKRDPNLTSFFFKLTGTDTNEDVKGQVYILENERDTRFESFRSNETVQLSPPKNSEKTYLMVVNAPGYKPVTTTINYEELKAAASEEVVVPQALKRSKRGDYIEFNNVRFLSNSAIFTATSKPELDAFAEMLKVNPKYKIKIHSHCNGKFQRNATIRDESPDYFVRAEGNKQISASPKQLTAYRASLFRDYLVDQGVSSKRIKTAAEGGSTMLFPQNGPLSGFNDRIEIEIIKGK
ncbi:OmpA family protein [Fulvivirga sp. M361]|uniref:OmpA family protein n=1 Tax=Fulvivirga sp. M361 TaxID=2594266 RepID=UPI00117B4036|nr:OmpA family protein [Fulvivirga sp. M361]TRX50908.1 OmpA family protein [Fulvivirga sp. M361]